MNKYNYTWKEYEEDVQDLATLIKNSPAEYEGVWGVPAGGVLLGRDLARILDIPYAYHPYNNNILIADDICDSGKTLEPYSEHDRAVLFTKGISDEYEFRIHATKDWVVFPWENTKSETGEDIIIRMLEFIGENPNRKGLIDTPKRVAKMWKEIFRGYDKKQLPDITTFENGHDGISIDEMICDSGYYFSHCEHHMVPFFGQYYFAYIPDMKILGLSKVARVIDFFSAKLQVQERLGKNILDYIEEEVSPLGCALILKGRHLCKEMRGVKKINGEMITSDLRGVFKENIETRQEFLNLIK